MRFSKRSIHPKLLRAGMILLCVLLSVSLFGCADTNASQAPTGPASQAPQIPLTDADKTTDADGAVAIDLNEVDGLCRIDRPGKYILSGELTGKIQIDVQDQLLYVILDNVTVNASAGPALEVLSAGKVILTVKDGTTNTLRDTADYPMDSEADACIYSVCDLTINGGGALTVSGFFKDAIHTKDVLKVLNKNCFIQSKRDGLHGNDGVVVCCEELSVQSERNGLHTTKTGKPAKGNVEIYDSQCSIIGGKYAVSCAADLYIADSGVYTVGVYGDLQVSGETYIAEGSLKNA